MDLRDVDLNLLVAFDALISERSVTAAGTRLSIGQSAMSSALGRLRTLLSDPVLVRQGRSMVPTPLATSLAAPVREALARFDAILAVEPLSFDPEREHRTFTVMASEYVILRVFQPLLIELRQFAPRVELRIQAMPGNFLQKMATGEADLTVVPPAFVPEDESFRTKLLYVDPYVVAVDVAHPDIAESISLEQFSSLPYLATGISDVKTLVEVQLDELGIARRIEAQTSFGLAPLMLRDTRMLTLMPLSWATKVAPGAGLRLLPPPMPLDPVRETMVWPVRNDRDTGHRWLRERLLDIASRDEAAVESGPGA